MTQNMILNATFKVGSPILPNFIDYEINLNCFFEIQYLTKEDMKLTSPFSFFVCCLDIKLY